MIIAKLYLTFSFIILCYLNFYAEVTHSINKLSLEDLERWQVSEKLRGWIAELKGLPYKKWQVELKSDLEHLSGELIWCHTVWTLELLLFSWVGGLAYLFWNQIFFSHDIRIWWLFFLTFCHAFIAIIDIGVTKIWNQILYTIKK